MNKDKNWFIVFFLKKKFYLYYTIIKMNQTKLSKSELLVKCEELGYKKCKSKNKSQLMELITIVGPT